MSKHNDYLRLVNKCVKKLKHEFENNPFNFLSEDDIKCHLFMKLWEKREFCNLEETEDKQKISRLHSEVTYFDAERKLRVHADLSAIDPKHTNVYSDRRNVGRAKLSKGYEFSESHFLIEIKFNRGEWSKERAWEEWKKDLDKLKRLRDRITSMRYFSIFFDKRGYFSSGDVNEMRKLYPGIKIVYAKPKLVS